MESIGHMDELRQSVAEGSYEVDTNLVAGTMARKILEAWRLQRIVSEYRDARNPEQAGHSRP